MNINENEQCKIKEFYNLDINWRGNESNMLFTKENKLMIKEVAKVKELSTKMAFETLAKACIESKISNGAIFAECENLYGKTTRSVNPVSASFRLETNRNYMYSKYSGGFISNALVKIGYGLMLASGELTEESQRLSIQPWYIRKRKNPCFSVKAMPEVIDFIKLYSDLADMGITAFVSKLLELHIDKADYKKYIPYVKIDSDVQDVFIYDKHAALIDSIADMLDTDQSTIVNAFLLEALDGHILIS